MESESAVSNIKIEVKKELDLLISGCEALDMELAFKAYSRNPEFFMIAGDGNYYDFQTFFENNKNYLATCSKFELETIKEDIKVLTDSLVIVSWVYKAVATLKTGRQDIWEKAGATFLFEKINGEWKIINYHESHLSPGKELDHL
ncbi:MAG: nuclear transport factor 2 family protein [Bacteroidales bacterium]|nr:nuclear transport factor 2 family protein [Bacteroidales bacterium]